MTRYARTKDGVYQILRETKISDDCIRYDVKPNKKLEYNIFSENIIKESNNLEDLLDEYVAKWKSEEDKKKYMVKKYDYWQDKDINNLFLEMSYLVPGYAVDYMNIYGAIWTDKGLIYVAKLNKDEEWELI